MKFIGKNGYLVEFDKPLSMCNKNVSPIKEIVERKDISQYSFSDVIEVPLSEVIPIQVNIVNVGQAVFFFVKSTFDKQAFVDEVSKLKEMPIDTFYDVLSKIKALDEVTSTFNPVFTIYNPVGKLKIYEDCYRTLNLKNKTIYISQTEDESIVVKGETNYHKESPRPVEQTSSHYESKQINESQNKEPFLNKVKGSLFNPFKVIEKDKYHFLFALVSTFLIGFTLSIAIYDAYAGKMICIFFFICSLAGSFLSFMIYKDSLKNNEILSPYVITTILSSVVGLGLSLGGYYLFRLITKDELVVQPKLIMIIGILVLVYILSVGIAYLTIYLKKRKK